MFTDSINDFKGSQRSYFCCTVDRYIRDMHSIMGSHPATVGHRDWWHQEWDCWEQVFFWCKLVTSEWNVSYSLRWQAYSAVWRTIQWFVKPRYILKSSRTTLPFNIMNFFAIFAILKFSFMITVNNWMNGLFLHSNVEN